MRHTLNKALYIFLVFILAVGIVYYQQRLKQSLMNDISQQYLQDKNENIKDQVSILKY